MIWLWIFISVIVAWLLGFVSGYAVRGSERSARPVYVPRAVIHRAQWKQLELPAVKRREQIRSALGWERQQQTQEPS